MSDHHSDTALHIVGAENRAKLPAKNQRVGESSGFSGSRYGPGSLVACIGYGLPGLARWDHIGDSLLGRAPDWLGTLRPCVRDNLVLIPGAAAPMSTAIGPLRHRGTKIVDVVADSQRVCVFGDVKTVFRLTARYTYVDRVDGDAGAKLFLAAGDLSDVVGLGGG